MEMSELSRLVKSRFAKTALNLQTTYTRSGKCSVYKWMMKGVND